MRSLIYILQLFFPPIVRSSGKKSSLDGANFIEESKLFSPRSLTDFSYGGELLANGSRCLRVWSVPLDERHTPCR
jgi:hypothetical protein